MVLFLKGAHHVLFHRLALASGCPPILYALQLAFSSIPIQFQATCSQFTLHPSTSHAIAVLPRHVTSIVTLYVLRGNVDILIPYYAVRFSGFIVVVRLHRSEYLEFFSSS